MGGPTTLNSDTSQNSSSILVHNRQWCIQSGTRRFELHSSSLSLCTQDLLKVLKDMMSFMPLFGYHNAMEKVVLYPPF